MVDVIARLKQGWEVLTGAATAGKNQKILDLQSDLRAERDGSDTLKRERDALKRENAELREQLNRKQRLILDRNAYWEQQAEGKSRGPFCTVCWEDAGKLISLRHFNYETFNCPKCNSVAEVPGAPGATRRPPPDPMRGLVPLDDDLV